jgi:hypothetical protein
LEYTFWECEKILTTIDDAISNNDSKIAEVKKKLDSNINIAEVRRLASSGDPWFHNYEKLNDIADAMVDNISLRAWQIEIVRVLTDHLMKLIEDMRKESRESVVGKYLEGMREKEKSMEDTMTMKIMENFQRMIREEREFSDRRINMILRDKGVIPKEDGNGHDAETEKPAVSGDVEKETEIKRREVKNHIKQNPGVTRNSLRNVVSPITIVDEMVRDNILDVDSTPKNVGEHRYFLFGQIPENDT